MMPIPPILLNKRYTEPSVFTAENLLREARRQKAIARADVPRICVLDPDGDIVRWLVGTHRAEREVATLEVAKHAGHYAAAFVREQYIHQAHTIITGNDSHLGHYDEVVQKLRVLSGPEQ